MPRRDFLQAGALALGGITLADVLRGRELQATQQNKTANDTSVILLYLHGGPSQLETYDLKTSAPSTYRSIYEPIPTKVPGMDVCELLPLHAKIADKFSLVRSLHHDVSIHSDGGIIVLTGKRPTVLDPTSGSKSEHPDFGSVASRVRGLSAKGIPPYVAIPGKLYMTRPTYLGAHHAAFELGDPSTPDGSSFAPPRMYLSSGRDVRAFDDRRSLLQKMDTLRADLDLSESLSATGNYRDRAFQMLTSSEAADAYDLSKEKATLRDRYGRHLWGQGCLLARRLAEAGSAVISLYIDAPKNDLDHTNWDDHIGNAGRPGHFGDYMRRRLLYLDQALSALIEDIFERGLDRRIMVVVVGEFGRTPRLSSNNQGVGRDHWPNAYTALVSGGGLKMGQVVGATNSKAEFPTERPYTPQDLLATVYRHLGINTEATFNDHSGRPIPILPFGEPIRELV
ncbi:MAG: DUF1501 domain-containing protein [Planctomycetaceae bacterium]